MRREDTADVGKTIRIIRKTRGMSQMELAEKIGVSYQQVQKYEYGTSQLTISRLKQISDALGVPVMKFIEREPFLSDNSSNLFNRDEIKLLRAFRKIRQRDIRKMILIFTEKMAGKS